MPETIGMFYLEFRAGAVRIVQETGKSIAEVARELGVTGGTLGNWVNKDRVERGEPEGLTVNVRKELTKLHLTMAWPAGSLEDGSAPLPAQGAPYGMSATHSVSAICPP